MNPRKGHLDLRVELADVAADVLDLVSLSAPLFRSDGFELLCRLQAGTGIIDHARIRQVLMALLDNARRHADPGPVTIDLSLSDTEIRLTIEDAGPGLTVGLARVAFEPFKQGEASVRTGGTGLGLAIVSGVALAHGGTAAYDASGPGGRFVLRLPRYPVDAPELAIK